MLKGLIVSGGHVNRDLLLKYLKTKPDIILAVDGGMNPLWVLGAKPDYILGDLDSCSPMALDHFTKEGVPQVTFNSDKDMTDTELAIVSLVERKVDEAVVLGATGSRFDHSLANLMLLSAYSDQIDLTIVNESNRIKLAKSGMVINKEGYRYLSLIPLSDEVRGVSLRGVKYPLEGALLKRASSYGVSNEIIGNTCALSFSDEKADMLVVQSND